MALSGLMNLTTFLRHFAFSKVMLQLRTTGIPLSFILYFLSHLCGYISILFPPIILDCF